MNRKSRLLSALPWLSLLAATFCVYFPAIHGGLIMDDAEHITSIEMQGWVGLYRIWFELGATPHYYPVLNSVFWLQHHLWGGDPVGYHIANIVEHALAASLVVLVVRQLGLRGAWLAGFCFALHPVQVESVAWISEQKNTLSTLFALAAALGYLKFEKARSVRWYSLASVLFLLALLTKTVVAVVPPALCVVAWWRDGRLRWRTHILPLLPWMAVGAVLGLFSAWFERVHSHAQGSAFGLSLLERTLVVGRALVFYFRTLVWPSEMVFINPRWAVGSHAVWDYLPVVAVIGAGGAFFLLAKKRRGLWATYCLYCGMLFPVLGFLNINWFNFSFVANHFQHLPSVGILIPLANVYAGWLADRVKGGVLSIMAYSIPVLALGGAAHSHCRDFRSAEILYTRTIELNPECWLAHNNLGSLLVERSGALDRARYHFEQAIALKPDHARAHHNLAVVLAQKGERNAAIVHFRTSLQLQWNVPVVHFHYAQVLVESGGLESEALDHLAEALRQKPAFPEAARLRAQVLADSPGRAREAITAHREALRIDPSSAEAANNLAILLAGFPEGLPEAEALLRRAVALAPDYADAHFNLAALLATQPNRIDEAVAQVRAGLQSRPADIDAYIQLAGLLIKMKQYSEAEEALRSALAWAKQSEGNIDAIAALLAQMPGLEAEAKALRHNGVRLK